MTRPGAGPSNGAATGARPDRPTVAAPGPGGASPQDRTDTHPAPPGADPDPADPDAPVIRHHDDGTTRSEALYSPCLRYRYALTRTWDTAAPRLAFVMLNPSQATEAQNDPTVARCQERARRLGYGALRVVNLFAWRETDPTALRRTAEPQGPDNDAILQAAALWSDAVLAGWGFHGAHLGRDRAVEALLRATGRPLLVLGLTQAGQPRHPLYISYATQPRPWPATGPASGPVVR